MQRSILALLVASPAAAAQFAAPVPGPGPAGNSDNVDFADVDLDGDWDAAFARGAEDIALQNMLWVNQGGGQGGVLGDFLDESATRFPTATDSTRDVEFGDIDNDGDLDLYLAADAQIFNQTSKWWVNQGGGQAGSVGFFADETATRWLGLGQAGSSIRPQILIGGGFIDWSGDGDFADLDNDGDLDLVHSSYGGSFSGQVPTRLFLNDGDGRFEEFNPSGFQLAGNNIQDGNPALWAEGRQAANTLDTTGAEADIAGTVLDLELADLDGDFDLDLVINSRDDEPRLFVNGLGGGGALSFRDVTAARLPTGAAFGGGNYDSELADMDGDADLDLYGLNWAGFEDRTLANDGSGTFSLAQDPIPDSGADDNEADWFDFDSDGDLDVYVANWSGRDKLYANDGTGALTLAQEIAPNASISLDADAADYDGDGDPDIIVALIASHEELVVNLTNVADTTPSSVPLVEDPGDQVAGVAAVPVRAHVLGNAPLYVTARDRTELELAVDGFELDRLPMSWSGGQVFRGELPGNLVGAVAFAVRTLDEYDNEGRSSGSSYAATSPLDFDGQLGNATPGLGGTPALRSLAVPFAGSVYRSGADGFAPGALVVTLVTTLALEAPLVLPGLGAEIWVGGALAVQQSQLADDQGRAVLTLPIPEAVPGGVTVFLQAFGVDGLGPALLSATPALSLTTQ